MSMQTKPHWHPLHISNIRSRLILYFLMITILMGVVSLYTFYNTRVFMDRMDQLYNGNLFLDRLMESVSKVEEQLETYLSTKSSTSLLDYYRYGNALRDMATEDQQDWFRGEGRLYLKDTLRMIGVFLEESDAAISAKRGRDIDAYLAHYKESSKITGYIETYVNHLNTTQFKDNTAQYLSLTAKLNWVRFMTLALFALSFLISVVLFLIFSYRITKPIIDLSAAAAEVSKGNFNLPPVQVSTHDEIESLAETFNIMTASIKTHVDEIRDRAAIEGKLREQEVQNLAMKNLLREAELQALQSQINPHFIFNTLNAGAQLAMMEGADRTSEFMEKLAALLRYNIRNLHRSTTLREELENAEDYVYLLQARFGDRFLFERKIEPDVSLEQLSCILMPRMILQPLLENAFIHGIGDLGGGNRIAIVIGRCRAGTRVVVEDNGPGIEPERTEMLLALSGDSPELPNEKPGGHTTGIGIGNVIRRMRLFYPGQDVFDIESIPGQGTRIILVLPDAEPEPEPVAEPESESGPEPGDAPVPDRNHEGGTVMYRMLAADDETIVLDSLRFIMEREYAGRILLETAHSGREAIERSESFRPDIVLMDIRMPGINGLQAIREIRAGNPDTIFLIMSAYEQFEHAREALELGVIEYLLKPSGKARIMEAIDKAILRIETVRKARKTELELRERFETVQQFLEHGFIYLILFEEEESEFESYRSIFGITRNGGSMMTIEITDMSGDGEGDNRIGLSVKGQKILPFIRDTLKSRITCIVGPLMLNRIMVFIPGDARENEYEQRVDLLNAALYLRDRMRERTGVSFRIGIGRIQTGFSNLRLSYDESLRALQAAPTREIMHIMDVPDGIRRTSDYPFAIERQLLDKISSGDDTGAIRLFALLFETVADRAANKTGDAALMLMELMTLVHRLLWDMGIEDADLPGFREPISAMLALQDMATLHSLCRIRIETAARAIRDTRRKRQKSVISELCGFIDANYQRDITLEEVSRRVNISPNYFSRFFKEETGENFIDYLTRIRMNRAMELLDAEPYSVKEISFLVGYGDPNYFSRAFKKAVGITPTEYRENRGNT